MVRSSLLRAALAAALLPFLIGCGGSPAAPTATPAETIAAPGMMTAPAPPPGGQSGVAGLVVAANDVAGQSDTALANQLVVAVPLAQADAALSLGGSQPTSEQLRFLKAQLPAGALAVTTTRSDAQGQYALMLAPGSYVLCLADSEQQPPALPATTRGCGQVDVLAGQVRRADLSSGFGEVLLIVR